MVMQRSQRGLQEWLLQRISAILIGVYAVLIVSFVAMHQPMNFADWHAFFAATWVRVATVVTVLLIGIHAWIGLWTIFTDYVKCSVVRTVLEVVVFITLLGLVVWVYEILRSVS